MTQLFLLGRVILGAYFIFGGFEHFQKLTPMSEMAAKAGVPAPAAAIALSGLLLLIGGASILLGVAPKLGVLALALFLVPVTLTMHRFWQEDGTRRMMDFVNFTKNFGLLGAVVMLVAIPEPWPFSLHIGHRLSRILHPVRT